MDSWGPPPPPQQRPKVSIAPQPSRYADVLIVEQRTFADMSMSNSTRSPQPLGFGVAPSLQDEIPLSYERRRRTSHPHNHSQGPRRSFATAEGLDDEEGPWSLGRPPLEHRASQTIVDLTGELDEPRRRSQLQPPRLGRSDSQALADVVDLTAEEDDDLIITESRPVNPPSATRAPQQIQGQRFFATGGLHSQIARRTGLHRGSPALIVPQGQSRRLQGFGYMVSHVAQIGERLGAAFGIPPIPNGDREVFYMAQHMDYEAHAFARPPAPAKPDHVAPTAVGDGFTRSPAEEDVVICPGCEEELVAQKVGEDVLPVKKNGKSPTKSEREQHPFWVVKECGHVS